MGSRETVRGLDKVYTALHRSIGPKTGRRVDTERDDRIYGEIPVDLQPTLTCDGPSPPVAASPRILVTTRYAPGRVATAVVGQGPVGNGQDRNRLTALYSIY